MAHHERLQGDLVKEAACLDLECELITGTLSPRALDVALAAVARVRAAILSCQVIRSAWNRRKVLGDAAARLMKFATAACECGLPDPTTKSEAAWLLLKTSITCGLELHSICDQESGLCQTWSIQMHVLQKVVDVWQAQP